MSEHCGECGSRLCNHGNCPGCRPCTHCGGGDREDKYFDDETSSDNDQYADRPPGWGGPHVPLTGRFHDDL